MSDLTAEQIAKMPAGRETDVLVAEAMGWTRRTFDGQSPHSLWDDEFLFNAMAKAGYTHISQDGGYRRVPCYSTDDAAACYAVDGMVEKHNCIFTVKVIGETYRKAWGPDAPRCSATIEGGDLSYDHPSCILTQEAQTRPLAISRAILKATLLKS